jgi:hypothetical protein
VWESIPTWLARAEDIDLAGLGYLEQISGLPYLRLDSDEHHLHQDIWIEDEFVVVEKPFGATRLLFVQEPPSPEDNLGLWKASERFAEIVRQRTLSEPDTSLEVFSHTGDQSVESSDSGPFRWVGGIRRAIVRARDQAGALIGRAVRKTVVRPRYRTSDPFWPGRFTTLEAKNQDLARAIPILGPPATLVPTALPPAGVMKELVILVHGTGSASMRMAAALYPDLKVHTPPFAKAWPRVLRFEHDTFHACEVNVAELVLRVAQYRGLVDSVLFLAHSRGGIVAASAAHDLQAAGGFKQIGVHTFGTPHAGTPLVLAGVNVFAVAQGFIQTGAQMGAKTLGSGAFAWVAGQAAGDLAAFPQGWADMEVGNSYLLLGLKRAFAKGTEAISWSAEFDPKNPAAQGSMPGGLLKAGAILFDPLKASDFPNDGVVPVSSANPPGWKHESTLPNCDHSAYFDRLAAGIRKRIGP